MSRTYVRLAEPDVTSPPLLPITQLSDSELFNAELVLHIACGRGKQVMKWKSRKYLCTLIQVLGAEANRRQKPRPSPPYRM